MLSHGRDSAARAPLLLRSGRAGVPGASRRRVQPPLEARDAAAGEAGVPSQVGSRRCPGDEGLRQLEYRLERPAVGFQHLPGLHPHLIGAEHLPVLPRRRGGGASRGGGGRASGGEGLGRVPSSALIPKSAGCRIEPEGLACGGREAEAEPRTGLGPRRSGDLGQRRADRRRRAGGPPGVHTSTSADLRSGGRFRTDRSGNFACRSRRSTSGGRNFSCRGRFRTVRGGKFAVAADPRVPRPARQLPWPEFGAVAALQVPRRQVPRGCRCYEMAADRAARPPLLLNRPWMVLERCGCPRRLPLLLKRPRTGRVLTQCGR